MTGRRERVALTRAVAGSMVAALALMAGCAGPSGPVGPARGGPSALVSPSAGPAETAVPAPAAVQPVLVPAGVRPVRVLIPRIGVDSALVDLGIATDGTLEVPADYQRAGWLDVSPAPGQRGPAVIAGHVDSKTGPAVFYRLHELRVGDAVRVVRADGRQVSFTVDSVQQYAKRQFPTAEVYGPVPGPVLRLITCGGSFDRASGHYLDNVVAYAS